MTPDAAAKTHYVIVDAVGVCEHERVESAPMDRQHSVPLKRILQVAGMGSTDPEVASTLAARLARLDRQISEPQRKYIEEVMPCSMNAVIRSLVASVDPDVVEDAVREHFATDAPTEEQIEQVGEEMRREALTPFLNPELRDRILNVQQDAEQTIDRVSVDEVLSAGHSEADKEKARGIADSFAAYILEHKDEITALQILYSRPYGHPLNLDQIRELAMAIERPPHQWTPELLWRAYETLEKSRVRGAGQRVLTDLVSLVRFALEQETVLEPFDESVRERFAQWLEAQESGGRQFTDDQRRWLEMIRDHIASSLTIETDDFDLTPFSNQGGVFKAYELFGDDLAGILKELNEVLAA